MARKNLVSFVCRVVGGSVLSVLIAMACCATASGQGTYFSRLDKNGNGYLDLNEIDDRMRSAIQRYADAGGLRMTRPNSIQKWEYAYNKYRENRSKSRYIEIEPEGESVQGFGPDVTMPLVPGFGAAKIEHPYNQDDIDQADSLLRRYDKNRDGFIDRKEAQGPRWTGTSPWDFDYDNDDRISQIEFAQRYAHRRQSESKSSNSSYYDPTSPVVVSSSSGRSSVEGSGAKSVNSDRNSQYLAASVFGRYDSNRDGKLTAVESRRSGVDIGTVDQNRDGMVDRRELDQWLYQEIKSVASSDADVLPPWFIERDLNGDSQVEMAEFTDEWDEDTADRFASYDANNDGIITTAEAMVASADAAGEYPNWVAQVLMPKRTLISEIEIEEDLVIEDLNVQLSITYTYDEHLDGYLAGPDGQRIELFTGVGRNDDHFDRTIFDDEASNSILRGRPPFAGSFQPEGLAKRQPGLSYFKGKSTKGVWQLIIQTSRCDRSGVFHGWSLKAETESRSEQESVDAEEVAEDEIDRPNPDDRGESMVGEMIRDGKDRFRKDFGGKDRLDKDRSKKIKINKQFDTSSIAN